MQQFLNKAQNIPEFKQGFYLALLMQGFPTSWGVPPILF